MNLRFTFEGGKEIAAALQTLSDRGARAVQREALADGAAVIRPAIAAAAPRRPPAPDIADHIVVSRINQGDAHGGGLAVGPERGRFFYGRFLEFGTVKMAPHPFMRPGFDATVGDALTTIGQSFWRELAAKGVSRTTVAPSVPSGPGRLV
jgi:HK97 gp10 family phage protein